MSMNLPKPINYSIHEILIPSIGKKLRFRPFLVKEYKALTIAEGSKDPREMLNTLKGIIQSTCLEKTPIDVDNLATFDFEYILIKLRSISVGSNVQLSIKCQHPEAHEGMDADSLQCDVMLDLNNIEVVGLKDYKTKIKLSDDCVVIMKKPTVELVDQLARIEQEGDDYEFIVERLAKQIDKIATGEEVFEVADNPEFNIDEVRDWIDNLTEEQYSKLNDYFKTIPYCRIKIEWTCPVCGNSNTIYIQGLDYFF